VLGKSLPDEPAQIRQRSAGGLAFLWIRPAQDAGDQGRYLALAQDRSAAAFGMIVETSQPLRVEALDGIAQGLALDPNHSRRIGPAHAL
jgi:hypothetical protein